MKIEVTAMQLERIIELLGKARIGRDDTRLIEYLKSYQIGGKSPFINYDEIPF